MILRASRKLFGLLNRYVAGRKFRKAGTFGGDLTVVGHAPRLELGGTCKVGKGLVLRGTGQAPAIVCKPRGYLLIGDDVFLNSGATIFAGSDVRIGDNTKIGNNTAILDTSFHEIDEGSGPISAPIVIGRNVWISRAEPDLIESRGIPKSGLK